MANRLDKLRARRDDSTVLRKSVAEEFSSLQEDDDVKYVVGAMQPIDTAYTQKSFDEGNRVANQIRKAHEGSNNRPEFAFQGSVTSDTHIKAHSDIDLLVVEQKFVYFKEPLQVTSPYEGDPIADFSLLRSQCAASLGAFTAAYIDDDPGKAIHISGGSLSRKVDIVIVAWLNTQQYVENGNDLVYRGIRVFDSALKTTVVNYPFLHNFRIHERDGQVEGNLRRAIRLLKTINADAEIASGMSSYDIAALAYRMPAEKLNVGTVAPLLLLETTQNWLQQVAADTALRSTLKVPNETRDIFGSGGATLDSLQKLSAQVTALATDIKTKIAKKYPVLGEHQVILKSIQEAKTNYPAFDRSRLVF